MTSYSAVEERHSSELRQTTAGLHEAQDAIAHERAAAKVARSDGRESLKLGGRENWIIARSQEEVTDRRRFEYERIRDQREEVAEDAKGRYIASRLKKEQIERLCEQIAERIELKSARRAQGSSDDRFAARKRWMEMRQKRRAI
jgi:hypothetical protein